MPWLDHGKIVDCSGIGLRTYKFKKTDTPEKVAKSFGHSKFATIWNHAKNRSLKSKRKSETSLVAGDTLSIPLNDAERKQILAEIELWAEEIRREGSLATQLGNSLLAVSKEVGNLSAARAEVQAAIKSGIKSMMETIKVLRVLKDDKKITDIFNKASSIAAETSGMVSQIATLVHTESVEIKKLLGGELKALAKMTGAAGSEGKSVIDQMSGFIDSVAQTASKATKEIGSAVTAKYWKDQLIYGDLELMDLDKAKSAFEKKLMQSINKIRKSGANTDVTFKVLLATAKVKLKYLETALSGCQKRLKSAEARFKLLPKPSDLKKM